MEYYRIRRRVLSYRTTFLANNLYLPNVTLPIIDSGDDSSTPFTSTPSVIQTEIVNVGGGSAVARAEMTGTGLGKNLVITAMPQSSLPSTITPPLTTVYQYLSITSSTITGAVSKVTFYFIVPQSWLTEHGFTKIGRAHV